MFEKPVNEVANGRFAAVQFVTATNDKVASRHCSGVLSLVCCRLCTSSTNACLVKRCRFCSCLIRIGEQIAVHLPDSFKLILHHLVF